MNNRWTDAARAAALVVRQARAMAARPVGFTLKGKPKNGMTATKPNPMVYAGGSTTFDERTGKYVTSATNKDIQADKVGTPVKRKRIISVKLDRPRIGPILTTVTAGGGTPKIEGPIFRDPSPDSHYWQDPDFVESWKKCNPGRKVPMRNRVVIAGRVCIVSGGRIIPYRKTQV
jgi:hypothetical protein